METQKNIGGLIALSVGIALILGAGIYGVVQLINNSKPDNTAPIDPMLAFAPPSTGTSGSSTTANPAAFTTEQIKQMQRYLLELGKYHNNQYIIDAIMLTGGIDGEMGEGFKAAIIEARDRGYLTGYEDVLAKLGY